MNKKNPWVIRNRCWDKVVFLNYFTLPVCGWFIYGITGVVIGGVLAYLVDKCTPKWLRDFNYSFLKKVLLNFERQGADRGRLHIKTQTRTLYFFRYKWDEDIKLAVQVPKKEWEDILTEDDIDFMLNNWGGYTREFVWKGKVQSSITGKLDNPIEACVSMLEFLLSKDKTKIQNCIMRVDYAKGNVFSVSE